MHYKREINYHDYKNIVIFFQHRNVNLSCVLQYFRTNSLHLYRGKMCQPCHPAGSIMVNPV